MSFWFYANLSVNGAVAIPDLECDLECSIGDDDGTCEPYLIVDAVSINGAGLPMPMRRNQHLNGMWELIAAEIIKQAEADDGLFERVLHENGISFVGHPNAPDSGWRHAAE